MVRLDADRAELDPPAPPERGGKRERERERERERDQRVEEPVSSPVEDQEAARSAFASVSAVR